MTGRYTLDVSKIVNAFGGVAATRAALAEVTPNNVPIEDGIRKWVARKSIPFQRYLDLKMIADRRRIPFKLDKFISLGDAA